MLSDGLSLLWRTLLVTGWVSSAACKDYCCIALLLLCVM